MYTAVGEGAAAARRSKTFGAKPVTGFFLRGFSPERIMHTPSQFEA